MAANEKTSKRVAKIAGQILQKTSTLPASARNTVYIIVDFGDGESVCTVGELRTLAASALTQAPDKKKKV